jgi:3D-(3,5/4)-trihydroxycyclohexane-1,2-dione acylhydrolase (decyclizing)
VTGIAELESALVASRSTAATQVIVIDTDAGPFDAGGFWWDVAVPQVSERPQVMAARKAYEEKRRHQRTRSGS